MSDAITRLNAALEGRYMIERELGEGGMALRVRAIYDQSSKNGIGFGGLHLDLRGDLR